ncbi:MAG: SGNH/GDSL hydrolase family protein [Clostridiales bacterium]|nr:SGNH/GDSL hydrolase family protein [Clostridiales bacterium]
MPIQIEKDSVVLFQGDSVTDAGRKYDVPDDLGPGYPLFTASLFTALYPELRVKFINRAVSGNRVKDLKSRWKKDCLDLNPSIVSILIGINDTWRRYDSNDPTSAEMFEETYRDILNQVRDNTSAKIVMLEPYLLPVRKEEETWREDLDPKIQVVRKLAKEFGAVFIPLDGIFAQASTHVRYETWSLDGVHPTAAGHALIAENWLKTVLGK